MPFVFKSSFDKANRTSLAGARGIGLETALAVFTEIRESLGLQQGARVEGPLGRQLHESAHGVVDTRGHLHGAI